MEKKRDHTIYCVSCKDYFERKQDEIDPDYFTFEVKKGSVAPTNPEPQISQLKGNDEAKSAVVTPTTTQNKTKDISAQLGEYLLKGWTM